MSESSPFRVQLCDALCHCSWRRLQSFELAHCSATVMTRSPAVTRSRPPIRDCEAWTRSVASPGAAQDGAGAEAEAHASATADRSDVSPTFSCASIWAVQGSKHPCTAHGSSSFSKHQSRRMGQTTWVVFVMFVMFAMHLVLSTTSTTNSFRNMPQTSRLEKKNV